MTFRAVCLDVLARRSRLTGVPATLRTIELHLLPYTDADSQGLPYLGSLGRTIPGPLPARRHLRPNYLARACGQGWSWGCGRRAAGGCSRQAGVAKGMHEGVAGLVRHEHPVL